MDVYARCNIITKAFQPLCNTVAKEEERVKRLKRRRNTLHAELLVWGSTTSRAVRRNCRLWCSEDVCWALCHHSTCLEADGGSQSAPHRAAHGVCFHFQLKQLPFLPRLPQGKGRNAQCSAQLHPIELHLFPCRMNTISP